MEVIIKAAKLAEHTFQITGNKKRYSEKHKMLAFKIQECALDIYRNLHTANSLKMEIPDQMNERLTLQTKAIAACDELACMVEMSLNMGRIGTDTSAVWQKLITDVKYMSISWRSKQKGR